MPGTLNKSWGVTPPPTNRVHDDWCIRHIHADISVSNWTAQLVCALAHSHIPPPPPPPSGYVWYSPCWRFLIYPCHGGVYQKSSARATIATRQTTPCVDCDRNFHLYMIYDHLHIVDKHPTADTDSCIGVVVSSCWYRGRRTVEPWNRLCRHFSPKGSSAHIDFTLIYRNSDNPE